MRTTLTLDEDVSIDLERLRRARGQSFKSLVNELLRLGISEAARQREAARGQRFETAVADTGPALLPNVDDVSGVLQRAGDVSQTESGRQ